MGDVDVQTAPALEGQGGRYTAMVHQDWEIWGPCGGYVAAIALRAAGAESPFARPASFFCHYLSVAAFEPVDLVVTPLRSGRTVLAQRVHMSQHGRAVLEAMV
jgi:acyl-CoA thioesterase